MFGTSFGNSASSGGAFAPSDITGLKLWLDADAANVNTEAAADFNGTNQYLSSTSTAFNKGNESFSFGGWVYIDALVNNVGLFGKYNTTGNQRSYQITMRDNSPYNFRILITPNGSGTGLSFVDDTLEITTSTWYFVVGCYDSDNDEIKLSVNGNNYASATHSTGADSSVTEPFTLGKQSTLYFNGREDLSFFYDKALSQSEVTALYNSGNATAYSSLSAAQKTDLVSWWSLSETSGTRYDQVITSANNLTDNGSVGWAAGILDEPVVNNSPVSLWIDKSTATNNATQATALNQPTWNISGGSNNTSFIDFDGSADYLSSVDFSPDVLSAGNQTFTFLSVFKLNSLSAANQIIVSLSTTGNAYNRFELRQSSTGELRILIRESLADGGDFVQTDVSTADTDWHYVLWTFDNDTLNCWLDGVKVITNASQGLDEILPQSFTLGALDAGSISFFADCSISECISYNNVVTAEQISNLDSYINTKYAAY